MGDESPCRGDQWSPVVFGEMRSRSPPCHSERSEESRREMLLSFLRPREILRYAQG